MRPLSGKIYTLFWFDIVKGRFFRAVPFLARMSREPQIKFKHKILDLLSKMAYPYLFGFHWNLVPVLFLPIIAYPQTPTQIK